MVANVTKEAIAISLFTGVILSLFVFIGTIAGNFVSEKIKGIYQGSYFNVIFLIGFVLILILTFFISMIILLTPTDLHIFVDIFRKIVGVK